MQIKPYQLHSFLQFITCTVVAVGNQGFKAVRMPAAMLEHLLSCLVDIQGDCDRCRGGVLF